jgi:hypothetical protein
VAKKTQPPGCRDVALATVLLLGIAVVFMAVGFSLIRGGECSGICETLGLTLLYAGGPVSALFGVLFGGVVFAWPLDVTLWVGAGFYSARIASRHRDRGALGVALLLVVAAVCYGLVLSGFVQIAEQ